MNSISWVPLPRIGLGAGETAVTIMGRFLVPAKCRVLIPSYPISFLPPSEGFHPFLLITLAQVLTSPTTVLNSATPKAAVFFPFYPVGLLSLTCLFL